MRTLSPAALELVIAIARAKFRNGDCRANPQTGDLVFDPIQCHPTIGQNAIGWLANHGQAPYNFDGSGPTREIWDILMLDGTTGPMSQTVRWENAEFFALPDDLANLVRR